MTSSKNMCLHIMTYKNHFEHCYRLIKAIRRNNIHMKIFIIFDNENEKQLFIKNASCTCTLNINFITMERIMIDIKNIRNVSYHDICMSKSNENKIKKNDIFNHFNYYRQYIVIKRSYSLIYLHSLGYKYIWAMDCESYPINDTDISDVFKKYWNDPFIIVANHGTKHDKLLTLNVNKMFKFGENSSNKYCFRQNDLFMYDMDIFVDCMRYLEYVNNKPLCNFMVAPEQMVYEIYIIKNSLAFKIVNLGQLNLRYDGFRNMIMSMDTKQFQEFINRLLKPYLFCLWGDHLHSIEDLKEQFRMIETSIEFVVSNCPIRLIK